MQARLLFLLVALSGLGLGRVLAQQGGNALYSTHGSQPDYHAVQQAPLNHERLDDNTLLINANIISNVAASSYVAIFSVTQYGRTASETDSLMNLRLQAASAALQALGVPKTDTHVDIISLVPTYAVKLEQKKFSRTANEVPTGFELKKNLHVIYTDDALLDRMVTSLARAEIYDLVKVDYNVAALQAAYDSLRLAGVAVVKRKEAEYARLGLHLEVQNMTDNFQAVYPLERYASYVAAHTGSSLEEVRLARQQQAANVYVSSRNATINVRPAPREEPILLRTADKQRTIYYNRTPYSSYDLVLHPDVAEPRVQLIYTMAVKYQVLNQQRYAEQEADRLRQREKAERDDKDARKARRKKKA